MCAWCLAVQYGGRGEKRIYCLGIQHGIRCAISEISGTGGTQQAIVEFKELSRLQTPRFMMVPAVQGPSEMPLMEGPLRRERDGNLRIRSNGIGAAIRVYRTHHDSRTGLRISEASCCVAEGARLFQDLHGGPLVFQPEDGPAMSTGSRREAFKAQEDCSVPSMAINGIQTHIDFGEIAKPWDGGAGEEGAARHLESNQAHLGAAIDNLWPAASRHVRGHLFWTDPPVQE